MSDSGAQPVAAQEAIEAFVDANDEQCSHFITSTFPSETALSDFARTSKRPWVTATWAQSLDGRIASLPGQPRLLISGQESMQMTFRYVRPPTSNSFKTARWIDYTCAAQIAPKARRHPDLSIHTRSRQFSAVR